MLLHSGIIDVFTPDIAYATLHLETCSSTVSLGFLVQLYFTAFSLQSRKQD